MFHMEMCRRRRGSWQRPPRIWIYCTKSGEVELLKVQSQFDTYQSWPLDVFSSDSVFLVMSLQDNKDENGKRTDKIFTQAKIIDNNNKILLLGLWADAAGTLTFLLLRPNPLWWTFAPLLPSPPTPKGIRIIIFALHRIHQLWTQSSDDKWIIMCDKRDTSNRIVAQKRTNKDVLSTAFISQFPEPNKPSQPAEPQRKEQPFAYHNVVAHNNNIR